MKRVGILRGGNDSYYESSIKEGAELIAYLSEHLNDKYKPIDILIDKDNVWHVSGLPVLAADLTHKVDMVWNTTHPSYSLILDNFNIPHVGNSAFSLSLAYNQDLLKEHLNNLAIQTPKHIVFPVYQEDFDGKKENYAEKKAKEVFNKFASPWLVKSFSENTTIGVHVAQTYPELIRAIEDVAEHGESILVEELIGGQEVSLHAVRGFRGDDLYTFPVDNISKIEKEKLNKLAKDLHHHLGGKHYMQVNCTIHPRRGIYLTSVNFNLNLNKDSHLSSACESVGAKMHHLVEHILESN